MKKLDCDPSAFSDELMNLGHDGYKGPRRWLGATSFLLKRTPPPPPAFSGWGLHLNVIKWLGPPHNLQGALMRKGHIIWLHRDAISKSQEAPRQMTWFLQQTRGKK